MRGVHPPKQAILKQYRALYKKLGRTPGIKLFSTMTNIRKRDVYYYWTYFDDLVREAGATPNRIPTALTDDEILRAYARVCLHLGKLPGQLELHRTAREIGARVYSLYDRFGPIAEFDRVFRQWLLEAPEEFKPILAMPGWRRKGSNLQPALPAAPGLPERPWLPGILRDLEALARQEMPAQVTKQPWAVGTFDARCAQAFQALGFRTEALERHPWRNRFVAVAPDKTCGVILESEAHQGTFVPPEAHDLALSERVTQGLAQLEFAGIAKVYLALIGPAFQESDLAALRHYLGRTPLAGITLFSAVALLRIVEESIRQRASFRLSELASRLAGYNLLVDERAVETWFSLPVELRAAAART